MAAAIGDQFGRQGGSPGAVPGKEDAAAPLAGGREVMALVRQLVAQPGWHPPSDRCHSPLAAVVLGLWFHDDERRLIAAIPEALESGIEGLVVGWAIAKILQGNLAPTIFLGELEQALATWQPEASLPPTFKVLGKALQKQDSLEQARRRLAKNSPSQSTAVSMALFCFLSTPDFPALSIRRAIHAHHEAALVGALTGAFCGAYNGTAPLPVGWEMALRETPLEQRWGVDSPRALQSWGRRLLAVWGGASPARAATMVPLSSEEASSDGPPTATFPTVAAAGQLRF